MKWKHEEISRIVLTLCAFNEHLLISLSLSVCFSALRSGNEKDTISREQEKLKKKKRRTATTTKVLAQETDTQPQEKMAISPTARLEPTALESYSHSLIRDINTATSLSPTINNSNNNTSNSRGQRSGSPGTAGSATNNANSRNRFDTKQHAIDVLTQELNGARAAAKRAQAEVALLRHQISILKGQGIQIRNTQPPSEEAWIIFCRSVLALGQCPDSTLLKSLHSRVPSAASAASNVVLASNNSGSSSSSAATTIDIEVPPSCDFVQLSALAEAVRVARPDVRRFALDVHEASHAPFIVQTVDGFASLRELCASRVTDASLPAVVHAIITHPELEVLELPQLALGDESAGLLRTALLNRGVLADSGAAAHLAPMELDFSQCYFKDAEKGFVMYGGRLESLILAQQRFFTFDEVRRALESCAGSTFLTHLSLQGTMVDNRVCSYLDTMPHVKELNLVQCNHITHIALKHVTHLHTDGRRVIEFTCPSLVEMCTPLTNFAPAIVKMPKIQELSFVNATLTKREMELLGQNCQTVLELKFLGCKLESLETALRQLRSIRSLSLHSCKGVRDSDITYLFEPLEELDLTDNFVLTDSVLDAVARCPRLRRLSLKRCQNITDLGIQKLEGHAALEFVNCLGLKKVSGAAVQRLIRASIHAIPSASAAAAAAQVFSGSTSLFAAPVSQAMAAAATVVEDGSTTVITSAAAGCEGFGGGGAGGDEQHQLQQVRPPLEVRHSTAISTDAMISRDDDEEQEKEEILAQEKNLQARRMAIAAFKRQLVRPGETGLAMSSEVAAAGSPSRLVQTSHGVRPTGASSSAALAGGNSPLSATRNGILRSPPLSPPSAAASASLARPQRRSVSQSSPGGRPLQSSATGQGVDL